MQTELISKGLGYTVQSFLIWKLSKSSNISAFNYSFAKFLWRYCKSKSNNIVAETTAASKKTFVS